MKKAIILCVLAVSFLMISGSAKPPQKGNEVIYEVVSGYFDEQSQESFGIYEGDAIPTKECAISVATAIQKEIYGDGRVPIAVLYDEACDIWIVHFVREPFNEYISIIGDACSISLRKTDGAVVRIQFHE